MIICNHKTRSMLKDKLEEMLRNSSIVTENMIDDILNLINKYGERYKK